MAPTGQEGSRERSDLGLREWMDQMPSFLAAHMSSRLGRAKKMSADLTGRAWPWTQPETVQETQTPAGPTVVITR